MQAIYQNPAVRRIPPSVGEITVIAGTLTSPAAVDLSAALPATTPRAWFTFQADGVDIGVIFGKDAADLTLAPDLANVTTDAQCIVIPAGTSQDFEIDDDHKHMRWVALTATGFFRYFRTSPAGPEQI